MPSHIQVHAFPYVAGEPVRTDGGAPSLPGRAGQHGAGFRRVKAGRVKAGRQAAAGGGDTPVAVDAGRRADGEPEAAADHLAALPCVSCPPSTTRPGSAFLCPPRRRLTAWRTP